MRTALSQYNNNNIHLFIFAVDLCQVTHFGVLINFAAAVRELINIASYYVRSTAGRFYDVGRDTIVGMRFRACSWRIIYGHLFVSFLAAVLRWCSPSVASPVAPPRLTDTTPDWLTNIDVYVYYTCVCIRYNTPYVYRYDNNIGGQENKKIILLLTIIIIIKLTTTTINSYAVPAIFTTT